MSLKFLVSVLICYFPVNTEAVLIQNISPGLHSVLRVMGYFEIASLTVIIVRMTL